MRVSISRLLLLLVASLSISLPVEARTWTNTKGQTIEAEWVRSDQQNITLKKPGGELVTFSIQLLSPADREHAAELAKENQHPAGWQPVEIVMESSWDTVSAVAMPDAFRREGARVWRAHLPPGAWMKLELRVRAISGRKLGFGDGMGIETHLMQWKGHPQIFLRKRGQLLQRSIDGGKRWELAGVDLLTTFSYMGSKWHDDYRGKLLRLGPVESVSSFDFANINHSPIPLDSLDPAAISMSVTFDSDFTPFGQRPRLRALYLRGQLKKFDSLSTLTRIECLDSGNAFTSTLEQFAPLAKMNGLRFLQTSLGSRADLAPIPSLQHLEALNMYAHEPKSLEALVSLKKLHSIGGLPIQPEILGRMPGIVRIGGFIPNVKDSPSPLFSLQKVVALGMVPVETLNAWKAAGGLAHLKEVQSLKGNPGEIQPLSKVGHLGFLSVYEKLGGNLSSIPRLQSLIVEGTGVDVAAALTSQPALESLKLELTGDTDLSFLKEAGSIRSLEIRRLQKLRSLAGIENLRNLQRLHIENCEQLQDISALAKLPALESLTLAELPQVKTLSLSGQKKLRDLDIDMLPLLTGISEPADATALEQIALQSCRAFTSLDGWENFRALRVAILSGQAPGNLKALHGLTQLEGFVLSSTGGNIPEDALPLRERTAKAALAAVMAAGR
jgi:hypothetical protein